MTKNLGKKIEFLGESKKALANNLPCMVVPPGSISGQLCCSEAGRRLARGIQLLACGGPSATRRLSRRRLARARRLVADRRQLEQGVLAAASGAIHRGLRPIFAPSLPASILSADALPESTPAGDEPYNTTRGRSSFSPRATSRCRRLLSPTCSTLFGPRNSIGL